MNQKGRRLRALLSTIALAFSLTACGGGGSSAVTPPGTAALSLEPAPLPTAEGSCLDGSSDSGTGRLCTQVGTQVDKQFLSVVQQHSLQGVLLSKILSVAPGVPTRAVTTWYFASCEKSLDVGSYSIASADGSAPKHGTLSFGTASGPPPGCPAGGASLPAATATYTWTDSASSTATSDSFVLDFNLAGSSRGTINVSVLLTAPAPPPSCSEHSSGTQSILGRTTQSSSCTCPSVQTATTKQGKIAALATCWYKEKHVDKNYGAECNKACAVSVNHLVYDATGSYICDKALSTKRLRTCGGLVPITQAEAGPGDFLIVDSVSHPGDTHIGVCTDTGCKTAISNSSGHCTFTFMSTKQFQYPKTPRTRESPYNGGKSSYWRLATK